jgi:hypothetical protein
LKVGCIVLAVLAFVLLAVASAGGAWWYWTGTPTYSLRQVPTALEERDVERFQALVDLDALLGSAFDQLAASRDSKDGWGEFGRLLSAAVFKPILVGRLKREILADVAAGRPPAAATLSARPVITGVESVTRRGPWADATLRVQDGGRSYVAAVRLRRSGRLWRVTEISNLADLVAEYRRPRP